MPKLDFSRLVGGGTVSTPEVSSVKSNMHVLQTVVETYGVDWGGTYAKDLTALQKEATKGTYWKDLTNPYTQKTGLATKANHFQGSMMEYAVYKNYKPSPQFSGLVLYEPIIDPKSKTVTHYRFYGCDVNGALIMDGEEPFTLYNG